MKIIGSFLTPLMILGMNLHSRWFPKFSYHRLRLSSQTDLNGETTPFPPHHNCNISKGTADFLSDSKGWINTGINPNTIQEKPIAYQSSGLSLVFWKNEQNKIIANRDFCPHRGVPLSDGWVVQVAGKNRLKCPYHGVEFDSCGICQYDPEDGKARPNIEVQNYL